MMPLERAGSAGPPYNPRTVHHHQKKRSPDSTDSKKSIKPRLMHQCNGGAGTRTQNLFAYFVKPPLENKICRR